METMRNIVIAACVVSVLTGIIQALKPNHRFDRQIRFFTVCLFVAAVAAPILRGIRSAPPAWDVSAAMEDYADRLTEECDVQTLELAQQEVAQVLQRTLASEGVPSSRLEVQMHRAGTECISIERVTVISTLPDRAAAILRNYLGEEVEIIADDVA